MEEDDSTDIDSDDTGDTNGDFYMYPPRLLVQRGSRDGGSSSIENRDSDDLDPQDSSDADSTSLIENSGSDDIDSDASPLFRRANLQRRNAIVDSMHGYSIRDISEGLNTNQVLPSAAQRSPMDENLVPEEIEVDSSSRSHSDPNQLRDATPVDMENPQVLQVTLDEASDLLAVAESTSQISPNPPTSNKRKPSSPKANPTPKKVKEEESVEDDADCCPICLEPWSNSGKHRLTSLKCGHLFGQKCIERWIKHANKCPQCNNKAKKGDIRVLFAKRLTAVDTTELTEAIASCEKERETRRNKEMELAQVRMQYQMMADENRRLKSQIEDLRNRQITSMLPTSVRASIEARSTTANMFYHVKNVIVSHAGKCRVMDYHKRSLSLAISSVSPHTEFLAGFGVKKFSAGDLRSCQFIIMHTKVIKDVKCCQTSGLVLTASQDQALKVTSMESNTIVSVYKPQRPVWCCCWNRTNPNVFYAGLNNGSMVCYDMRGSTDPLFTLSNPSSRCPIVSMFNIPPQTDQNVRGGLLVQTLEGVTFWQNQEDVISSEYTPYYLPLDPGNSVGLQYSDKLKECLITYRPGRSYPCTTHLLCHLQFPNEEDGEMTSTTIETFHGGQTHKMLTRNALFSTSHSNLVCFGDEAESIVKIYNAKAEGGLMQSLACDGPALDILPFKANNKQLLATLTDKELKIYEQK